MQLTQKTGLTSLQLDEPSPQITNFIGIAEALNSYFTSIGPSLATKLSYDPFESEITSDLTSCQNPAFNLAKLMKV